MSSEKRSAKQKAKKQRGGKKGAEEVGWSWSCIQRKAAAEVTGGLFWGFRVVLRCFLAVLEVLLFWSALSGASFWFRSIFEGQNSLCLPLSHIVRDIAGLVHGQVVRGSHVVPARPPKGKDLDREKRKDKKKETKKSLLHYLFPFSTLCEAKGAV